MSSLQYKKVLFWPTYQNMIIVYVHIFQNRMHPVTSHFETTGRFKMTVVLK